MIEAVVSDSDGTLVNSVSLIRHGQYETAVTFLKQHGIPTSEIPNYEQYASLLNKHVGGSARQVLELTVKALYEDKSHHLDGIDYDELHSMLDPIQDRIAPEHIKAYSGLAPTLGELGRLGVSLAIFSSGTPHHIVRNIGIALRPQIGDLADLYLDKSKDDQSKLSIFIEILESTFNIPRVAVITAIDVGEKTKPNPLSVSLALERLHVRAEESLVLGDHSYDMQAGLNANIPVRVGITHGFDDGQTLSQAGATKVIGSLPELVPLLRGRAN